MKTKYLPHILSAIVIVTLSATVLVQNAHANQPHMQSALESLRSARSELNAAEHDKGGHRTQAVNLIDQAIEQVKLGMADAK